MSSTIWRRRIAREWLGILLADRVASVDRVTLDDIPADLRRGVVGSVVADFRDLGFIVSTETYEMSQRKQAHKNPKRRWRLIDEPGARTWLRRHRPLTPKPIRTLFDDLD